MTKVVDLSGKVITEAIPATTPLSVLKEMVADIEAGEINPDRLLVLTMSEAPGGKVAYESWCNQLTLQDRLWLLEIERIRLMTRDA